MVDGELFPCNELLELSRERDNRVLSFFPSEQLLRGPRTILGTVFGSGPCVRTQFVRGNGVNPWADIVCCCLHLLPLAWG